MTDTTDKDPQSERHIRATPVGHPREAHGAVLPSSARRSAITSELVPFLLHLAQGGAMLALRSKLDVKVPVIRQVFDKNPTRLGTFDLSLLLPVFPLLSAANHGIALAELSMGRHISPSVKWYEYSISAGVMLWLISSLSGILDLRTLVSIAVSNALLQFIGARIEKDANHGFRNIFLMLVAWVVHTSIWLQIVIGFYGAIAETSTETPVPSIVYGIVWIMFSLFSGFGIWSLVTFRQGTSKVARPSESLTPKSVEALFRERIGYNTLSLVTKSVLIWMVFFGLKNADIPVSAPPPADP